MIRTLIIDDEPAIRRDLSSLLSKRKEFIEIGQCGSIREALVLIPATSPQLVLLDIQLSDGISFSLLQQLASIDFKIIFITADNEGALRAIKAGAMDYILKPVDETELEVALLKTLTALQPASPIQQQQLAIASKQLSEPDAVIRHIALRTQQYVELVQLEDIQYATAEGSYTKFHLANNKKLLISRPLKEYEDLLPESLFIRPHQSYLVQKAIIIRYHKNGLLILKDGTEIPVSTRRRDAIMASLSI